jgi:hypothetical protein
MEHFQTESWACQQSKYFEAVIQGSECCTLSNYDNPVLRVLSGGGVMRKIVPTSAIGQAMVRMAIV